MQCRRAVGLIWGFKPATMRWIYNVMVKLDTLVRGNHCIWINGTKNKHNQTLLNGVQRLANVVITGALPTTPETALDVITGSPPLLTMRAWPVARSIFDAPLVLPYVREANEGTTSWITPLQVHLLWLSEEAAKGALRLRDLGHWLPPPAGRSGTRITSHISTNDRLLRDIPECWLATHLSCVSARAHFICFAPKICGLASSINPECNLTRDEQTPALSIDQTSSR